jgi:hypothetical protein
MNSGPNKPDQRFALIHLLGQAPEAWLAIPKPTLAPGSHASRSEARKTEAFTREGPVGFLQRRQGSPGGDSPRRPITMLAATSIPGRGQYHENAITAGLQSDRSLTHGTRDRINVYLFALAGIMAWDPFTVTAEKLPSPFTGTKKWRIVLVGKNVRRHPGEASGAAPRMRLY